MDSRRDAEPRDEERRDEEPHDAKLERRRVLARVQLDLLSLPKADRDRIVGREYADLVDRLVDERPDSTDRIALLSWIIRHFARGDTLLADPIEPSGNVPEGSVRYECATRTPFIAQMAQPATVVAAPVSLQRRRTGGAPIRHKKRDTRAFAAPTEQTFAAPGDHLSVHAIRIAADVFPPDRWGDAVGTVQGRQRDRVLADVRSPPMAVGPTAGTMPELPVTPPVPSPFERAASGDMYGRMRAVAQMYDLDAIVDLPFGSALWKAAVGRFGVLRHRRELAAVNLAHITDTRLQMSQRNATSAIKFGRAYTELKAAEKRIVDTEIAATRKLNEAAAASKCPHRRIVGEIMRGEFPRETFEFFPKAGTDAKPRTGGGPMLLDDLVAEVFTETSAVRREFQQALRCAQALRRVGLTDKRRGDIRNHCGEWIRPRLPTLAHLHGRFGSSTLDQRYPNDPSWRVSRAFDELRDAIIEFTHDAGVVQFITTLKRIITACDDIQRTVTHLKRDLHRAAGGVVRRAAPEAELRGREAEAELRGTAPKVIEDAPPPAARATRVPDPMPTTGNEATPSGDTTAGLLECTRCGFPVICIHRIALVDPRNGPDAFARTAVVVRRYGFIGVDNLTYHCLLCGEFIAPTYNLENVFDSLQTGSETVENVGERSFRDVRELVSAALRGSSAVIDLAALTSALRGPVGEAVEASLVTIRRSRTATRGDINTHRAVFAAIHTVAAITYTAMNATHLDGSPVGLRVFGVDVDAKSRGQRTFALTLLNAALEFLRKERALVLRAAAMGVVDNLKTLLIGAYRDFATRGSVEIGVVDTPLNSLMVFLRSDPLYRELSAAAKSADPEKILGHPLEYYVARKAPRKAKTDREALGADKHPLFADVPESVRRALRRPSIRAELETIADRLYPVWPMSARYAAAVERFTTITDAEINVTLCTRGRNRIPYRFVRLTAPSTNAVLRGRTSLGLYVCAKGHGGLTHAWNEYVYRDAAGREHRVTDIKKERPMDWRWTDRICSRCGLAGTKASDVDVTGVLEAATLRRMFERFIGTACPARGFSAHIWTQTEPVICSECGQRRGAHHVPDEYYAKYRGAYARATKLHAVRMAHGERHKSVESHKCPSADAPALAVEPTVATCGQTDDMPPPDVPMPVRPESTLSEETVAAIDEARQRLRAVALSELCRVETSRLVNADAFDERTLTREFRNTADSIDVTKVSRMLPWNGVVAHVIRADTPCEAASVRAWLAGHIAELRDIAPKAAEYLRDLIRRSDDDHFRSNPYLLAGVEARESSQDSAALDDAIMRSPEEVAAVKDEDRAKTGRIVMDADAADDVAGDLDESGADYEARRDTSGDTDDADL